MIAIFLSVVAPPRIIPCAKATLGRVKLKKLKAKKTYYVRVRAYKTVNGTRVYGKWSAKKRVTTK